VQATAKAAEAAARAEEQRAAKLHQLTGKFGRKDHEKLAQRKA